MRVVPGASVNGNAATVLPCAVAVVVPAQAPPAQRTVKRTWLPWIAAGARTIVVTPGRIAAARAGAPVGAGASPPVATAVGAGVAFTRRQPLQVALAAPSATVRSYTPAGMPAGAEACAVSVDASSIRRAENVILRSAADTAATAAAGAAEIAERVVRRGFAVQGVHGGEASARPVGAAGGRQAGAVQAVAVARLAGPQRAAGIAAGAAVIAWVRGIGTAAAPAAGDKEPAPRGRIGHHRGGSAAAARGATVVRAAEREGVPAIVGGDRAPVAALAGEGREPAEAAGDRVGDEIGGGVAVAAGAAGVDHQDVARSDRHALADDGPVAAARRDGSALEAAPAPPEAPEPVSVSSRTPAGTVNCCRLVKVALCATPAGGAESQETRTPP